MYLIKLGPLHDKRMVCFILGCMHYPQHLFSLSFKNGVVCLIREKSGFQWHYDKKKI